MPATLRSGRSSSRPLVMYAGRPNAASPSPTRETTGPPPPSVAAGMRIRPPPSLTMATTVPAGRSQRCEEHQDLVPVAIGESQRARPAPDLLPAEPAVEPLEALASAGFQAQLFQAHLVTGDPAGLVHQRDADATPAETGTGL